MSDLNSKISHCHKLRYPSSRFTPPDIDGIELDEITKELLLTRGDRWHFPINHWTSCPERTCWMLESDYRKDRVDAAREQWRDYQLACDELSASRNR